MNELLQFAYNAGARVIFMDFESDAKGLMIGNRDGTFKIGIRKGLSESEATYTLAHELAHIYLHIDKGNTIESPHHLEYEEQADRAAKMLLDFMKVRWMKA